MAWPIHIARAYEVADEITKARLNDVAKRAKWGEEREAPRLLRSLPIAKTCIHLGSENAPEKPGCGTCSSWNCGIHGKIKLSGCVNCPDWQHVESSAVATESSRQTIKFDHRNLAPGKVGLRFNPSLIESGEGFLFAWRTGWAGSNIWVMRLNRQFEPAGEAVQLHLGRMGCGWGREDPRLFRLNGKLHLMFIGVIGRRGPTNVCFARINEDTLEVEDRFFPKLSPRNSWEKNFCCFDYQGVAHAVYTINPHKIIRVEGNKAEHVFNTPFPGHWEGGHMRGGAAPVLHNGEWYSFFHGKWDNLRKRLPTQSALPLRRHVYNIGVYTFSPVPPFQVLRYCPVPIDVAEPDTTDENYCDCVFPGGAVLVDGQWAIAMGVNDRRSEIRFFDAGWIESQLTKVSGTKSASKQDFTIISNNCWSNKVYEQLGVAYQTPFVNLFFHPEDYLKMLRRLKWYLAQPLAFIERSRHASIQRIIDDQQKAYPIALLGGDVEVHCLHFNSREEVLEKWAKRLARMSQDESRWFYKFCDDKGATPEQLKEFDAMPFKNKICYTSKPMPGLKSALYIPGGDSVSFQDQTDAKHFDAVKWVTE